MAPDKLVNHQKRQLVRAAGRIGSLGAARSFYFGFQQAAPQQKYFTFKGMIRTDRKPKKLLVQITKKTS